ncbi:hypothetical protein [Cellulomonas sp. KRMCY2]|uniref:hypothetical protein n=1 Tax=Cellulomonas sp. KRMCY2 TaxID=1304865 RepID=UPI0004B0BAF6|nr:hypothetical protein [Cellulomonas sp. KRMCY2]
MNENFPDEPTSDARIPATSDDALVARLRAADPAATVEPDATVLRAIVEARRAQPGDAPALAATDELAAARARRWTTWPARVAAVAAAALVIGGGGGYAIGAASGDEEPLATGAGREITLDSGTGSSAVAPDVAGPGSAPEAAMGESSRVASDMYWPGYSGRTIFTASGLSDAGGTAQAWALDPAQVFTEQSVTAAAAALGVAGTPTFQDGYWLVGPTDGSGPNISLYPDGAASLSYYDPGKDPWTCVATLEESATKGDAAQGSGTDDAATTLEQSADPSIGIVAPEPDPCTQRDVGPAPAADAAQAQLSDVLTALGIDVAGYELVAENWGDASWVYVTAYQVIDGQRTGVTWSGSFTGAGLQSLYGSLAPAVSLGEYEVISPAAAVARFADPRFGSGWGGPIAYAAGAEPAGDLAATSEMPVEPTLPATVTPGSAISWPVDEVTIVEARLGLAMHTQADGATLLLPTYELVSADGGIWSMLAVADAHLDFSSGR